MPKGFRRDGTPLGKKRVVEVSDDVILPTEPVIDNLPVSDDVPVISVSDTETQAETSKETEYQVVEVGASHTYDDNEALPIDAHAIIAEPIVVSVPVVEVATFIDVVDAPEQMEVELGEIALCGIVKSNLNGLKFLLFINHPTPDENLVILDTSSTEIYEQLLELARTERREVITGLGFNDKYDLKRSQPRRLYITSIGVKE
jgi:hypothetical protein